ncbi:alpha-E domain-containing protein [Nocardioides nitrophenolicus]|uniref:alpha-E domain-containing protein n=1 Tax=Nocardioides nitrophenolicus TaxID=60489 RepID=UPI00195C6A2E|nr:alpha-E domain-containing protein [Nocardioides nitrophenolicus]MBM7515049.1 putative alpha-E superfamily protein [Nocardioides nitrophenolicus]
MLSRIAESLFWIGRYVERADDTARILDVQTQLVLEDPTSDESATCRTVLSIMGAEAPDDEELDVARLFDLLAHDLSSPESIAACLQAARESARRARETLSEPLWVAINTTYLTIDSGAFRAMRRDRGLRWVRDQAALVNGTADATMTRDEGWQFFVLGRTLERADMTARLLASAALSPGHAWTTTLRACGAHEAFLRARRGLETDREVVEFLLLDRLFPGAVAYAVTSAERCLANLDSTSYRAESEGEARRILGRARSELEYRSVSDLLDDLPGAMDRFQRSCAAATDAITRHFFAGSEALAWHGTRQ